MASSKGGMRQPIFLFFVLYLSLYTHLLQKLQNPKPSGGGSGVGPELLKKPVVLPKRKDVAGAPSEEGDEIGRNRNYNDYDEEDEEEGDEKWMDWEERILEDTTRFILGYAMLIVAFWCFS